MEFQTIALSPTSVPSRPMLRSIIALQASLIQGSAATAGGAGLHLAVLRYGDRRQQADVLGKLGGLINT
jgi:hypothetical protein